MFNTSSEGLNSMDKILAEMGPGLQGSGAEVDLGSSARCFRPDCPNTVHGRHLLSNYCAPSFKLMAWS
jgi:hypothetical protein